MMKFFNEEKPPLVKHFLDSFDSCVAYIVDYSCVSIEHWGCCKIVIYTIHCLMFRVCILILFYGNASLNL
jgi:hypothetical protein